MPAGLPKGGFSVDSPFLRPFGSGTGKIVIGNYRINKTLVPVNPIPLSRTNRT
jgi:hypothetical protein